MSSLWKRTTDRSGVMLAQPKAPPPRPETNVHSLIGGNGQHYVLPSRTGGQPWIGHGGKAAVHHSFSPSESFAPHSGGVVMPNPTRLQSTVPAVMNAISGQAAGTFQLAPGGGVNMPPAQSAPGGVGR